MAGRILGHGHRPYLWIYPISIWVLTGALRPEQVQPDLAEAARVHGFDLVLGNKLAWGWYWKLSKLGRFPRLPRM